MTTQSNPLGLNLVFKTIEELPKGLTKGQLAKMVMPEGMTYDYALPQGWLDQFIDDSTGKYYEILGTCVTAYPKGDYFGTIVNLVTGATYNL